MAHDGVPHNRVVGSPLTRRRWQIGRVYCVPGTEAAEGGPDSDGTEGRSGGGESEGRVCVGTLRVESHQKLEESRL